MPIHFNSSIHICLFELRILNLNTILRVIKIFLSEDIFIPLDDNFQTVVCVLLVGKQYARLLRHVYLPS